jgi:hypothetical protein
MALVKRARWLAASHVRYFKDIIGLGEGGTPGNWPPLGGVQHQMG